MTDLNVHFLDSSPDPLRVEAARWLESRPYGPMTFVAHKVRLALGAPWPDELVESTARFRRVK